MSTAINPSRVSLSIPGPSHSPVGAARIFVVIFSALVAVLTFTCRQSIFSTPYYEEGDDAANALQIHRAKQFRELHGNYSRWQFHHPGPAFFYAYALGEWLLHDVTGIAPAPRNSHVYTGALLQLAFYAAALTLLARHSRQPFLCVALALVAGAFHFSQIEREHFIYSIWPPDVLIMPFLCFVISAAAVAQKDRIALPLLVLSGSFLVHGHVAQPLFVIPMSITALSFAWRCDWRAGVLFFRHDRVGHLFLALLALFLLPLAVDLLAGRDSNANAVLRHLRFQTDNGQTLWQSVLCYTSYYIPLHDQTIFNSLDATSYAAFRERRGTLSLWVGLFALVAWALRLRRNRSADEEAVIHLQFGRLLFTFWLIGGALTLLWGMRQDGGFTTFNSDFNHSLVHILALLAIVVALNSLPLKSTRFGWVAVACAAPVFSLALPFHHEIGSRGNEIEARVTGLLSVDPKPAAPKLITWDIPNEDWYESVTLARAFQRREIKFYVHPSWRFMFTGDHLLENAGAALNVDAVSRWHVMQRSRAPAGAHVLDREYRIVFPRNLPSKTLPVRIDFSDDEHLSHLPFGISPAEGTWAWTYGNTSALHFHIPNVPGPIELAIDAFAFVVDRDKRSQRLNLHVNGVWVGEHLYTDARQLARFTVSAIVWNSQSPATVVLELPDASAPASLGISADTRPLALGLHQLWLSRL